MQSRISNVMPFQIFSYARKILHRYKLSRQAEQVRLAAFHVLSYIFQSLTASLKAAHFPAERQSEEVCAINNFFQMPSTLVDIPYAIC